MGRCASFDGAMSSQGLRAAVSPRDAMLQRGGFCGGGDARACMPRADLATPRLDGPRAPTEHVGSVRVRVDILVSYWRVDAIGSAIDWWGQAKKTAAGDVDCRKCAIGG